MATYSPSDLAHQLSRNSTPYFDPLSKIRWSRLRLDEFWLPPQALSLAGVPRFESLPLAQRQRLSQYEFLNFIEVGLWLEAIFMERIARALQVDTDRAIRQFRLHELREEAGHSLMFLELMARSALPAPHGRRHGVALTSWFARHAPLESLGFWLATIMGEEIPDRLNRYVRKHAQGVNSVIVDICTTHIVDEARHIAYAREAFEQRLAGLPAWRCAVLTPLMQVLLRQFVQAFYFPRPSLYRLAGLPRDTNWATLARNNPQRIEFVDRCLEPTLQTLGQRGFDLSWRPLARARK